MDQLPNFVMHGFLFSRPDLETSKDGDMSLSDGQSSRPLWPTATVGDSKQSGAAGYSTESGRHSGTTLTDTVKTTGKKKLNPLFVTWLQGLPPDWLSPERINSEGLETWLCQQRVLLRSLL